ncbi:serine hydroxymethyltransferase [Candidatus Absconditicoccus praedator]|uniref:serine hydroxymethyltransferase n=1 Tax=Candidatus Absconditicoccus praedator TaxID=2735562 RepID=UPI001E56D904|nr:serine hydroxymethyltransferase [Candidatus Absconditicoccus praedator]UFX83422.1 serine hydroxymethyltransferase [Candidatus Absconditicoccus praedator]
MYKLSDNIVQNIIDLEYSRQQSELEMIASENYVSKDVMMAYSNVFTNKYSEGYPGKRYYGGQEYVDQLEVLTQKRALDMFGLSDDDWYVNVQPLSGAPANLAVFLGLLKPGDTILGMDLSAGGHLTHGHPLNSSGIYYNIVSYGVRKEDYLIDYDELLSKALDNQPKLIIGGFSAYPREIDWKKFSDIADQVEDKYGYRPILMADIAHVAGLIAGKVYNSPFPYFDVVTTTTHKTLRGPRGGLIYCKKQYQADINRGVFPGIQGGPHEHIIAAKAVAFGEVISGQFSDYAENVVKNAKALAEKLSEKGWHVITGGTDNHIVLLDVTSKNGSSTGIGGKIAEKTLETIGISLNKNMLPFDQRKPMDPSGLRIGTAAVTTRGFDENTIRYVAELIDQALMNYDDDSVLSELKSEIKNLCEKFPLQY